MKVLGRDKLTDFMRVHANSQGAIQSWLNETEEAAWKTPQDVKSRYQRASFLPENRIVFRIKGNHYRLVVKARYRQGILMIEWVGTHAEYDKQTF